MDGLPSLIWRGPRDLAWRLRAVQEKQVQASLHAPNGATDEHALALLSPAADAMRPALLEAATVRTAHTRAAAIRVYAPLYISSACTNNCRYCQFQHANPAPRVVLGPAEIEAEACALAATGVTDVLLLAGDDRRVAGVDALESAVKIVSPHFRAVGLEVAPLDVAGYERLHRAGVSSVTVYQETYDHRVYSCMHRAGRKRNFTWRLHTPERVLAGGIPTVGIGALLGLSSWRFEGLALYRHAVYLRGLFPNAGLMISFPRLRSVPDGMAVPAPVSDDELIHLMCALRVLLPNTQLVLSTREPSALRDRIAPRLIDRISAGSRTAPGGYVGAGGLAQFDLQDRRSVAEVSTILRRSAVAPI